mmetsp:Transcript_88364/g.223041  ORF Transcript_88364/g.223041 Transcript_88364/m.223041 type:complete len:101 (-) Transcript_88364:8-310(-)
MRRQPCLIFSSSCTAARFQGKTNTLFTVHLQLRACHIGKASIVEVVRNCCLGFQAAQVAGMGSQIRHSLSSTSSLESFGASKVRQCRKYNQAAKLARAWH